MSDFVVFAQERNRAQQPQICDDGYRSPATAQVAECLLQPGGRPLSWALCVSSRAQETSSGGFSELLRGAPLSCHCIESGADAWRCLPPTRHSHCTVCKRRADGLECTLFITPVTVCYIAVPYHTFQ